MQERQRMNMGVRGMTVTQTRRCNSSENGEMSCIEISVHLALLSLLLLH